MADVNTVQAAKRRKQRSRTRLKGTSERPRLSVVVSNTAVTAQVIDDTSGKTLAAANSTATKGSMTEKATAVGTQIAEAAKKAKVKAVVFDRGPKQYHGRVQAVADAARKAGLEV